MAYVSLSVNVTIINPKVAGFESKERLHSSEIKEDGLRFVERQRDDQPLQSWVFFFFFFWEQAMPTSLEIEEINLAINPKQEQAYVSLSEEMKAIYNMIDIWSYKLVF